VNADLLPGWLVPVLSTEMTFGPSCKYTPGGINLLMESRLIPKLRKETTMGFAQFMASGVGRSIRIIAGIAMVVLGASLGGGWWWLAVVGLVPLLAGVFDFCLLDLFVGQPMSGKAIRH